LIVGFGAALVARLNVSAPNRVPASSLKSLVGNRGKEPDLLVDDMRELTVERLLGA
jgi:hypothetical protein